MLCFIIATPLCKFDKKKTWPFCFEGICTRFPVSFWLTVFWILLQFCGEWSTSETWLYRVFISLYFIVCYVFVHYWSDTHLKKGTDSLYGRQEWKQTVPCCFLYLLKMHTLSLLSNPAGAPLCVPSFPICECFNLFQNAFPFRLL